MTATSKKLRLKIECNIWGNFKAYRGRTSISVAGAIYDLAYNLTKILTPEEQASVEFYGSYAEECRKHFNYYRA